MVSRIARRWLFDMMIRVTRRSLGLSSVMPPKSDWTSRHTGFPLERDELHPIEGIFGEEDFGIA